MKDYKRAARWAVKEVLDGKKVLIAVSEDREREYAMNEIKNLLMFLPKPLQEKFESRRWRISFDWPSSEANITIESIANADRLRGHRFHSIVVDEFTDKPEEAYDLIGSLNEPTQTNEL